MSLYQVSEKNTVVTYSNNRTMPNKVAKNLNATMQNLVIAGKTYNDTLKHLTEFLESFKKTNTKGSLFVNLSTNHTEARTYMQGSNSVYLKFHNDVLATYTEYLPLTGKEAKNDR